MLRYQLKFGVTVSLDSDDPNEYALIQYGGHPVLVEEVQRILRFQSGAFGHLIGNETTPIDLDAAMSKPEMQQFRPSLVEGADLVKKYNPGIPPGAKT